MLNIAVFVSGGGTNLQAIIDGINNNQITNGVIKLVISNNSKAYALERAKKNNIKSLVFLKNDYDNINIYEKNIIENLEENFIDLIVLAGFTTILSKNFVKKYENKIINIHPSLIPSFCGDGFYGLNVHKAVLDRGVKITGATVHFVNEIVDGGDIIVQKAVEVFSNDTPESLQLRVMQEAEWSILIQAIDMICNNKFH